MVVFSIKLPNTIDSEAIRVEVLEQGDELPEYGQVWIWDMVLAQVLNHLGQAEEAEKLKEILDLWAVNMSSKVHQPYEHVRSKGHTVMHEALQLAPVEDDSVLLRVDVEGRSGELPQATVVYPKQDVPAQAMYAVIALAQFFIDKNPLFAKELPIHILAFRKYYADVNSHHSPSSVEEAPMFAIQKALEYFNSVAQGQAQ